MTKVCIIFYQSIFISRSLCQGKRVFWHSSAHILGEAAERRFGCHLCIGPPTDEGFYYEMGMGMTDRNILESDIRPLEDLSKIVIKEKQKFERLVLSKETLLEMFRVRSVAFQGSCSDLECFSIINTKYILFKIKFQTAPPLLCIDADLWLISV